MKNRTTFVAVAACILAPMATTGAMAQSFPPISPGAGPLVPPPNNDQGERLRREFEEQQREAEEREAEERAREERLAEYERTRPYRYEAYCLIDKHSVSKNSSYFGCSEYVTSCYLSGHYQGEIYGNADPYPFERMGFSVAHDDNHAFAVNAVAYAIRAMEDETWVRLEMRTESGPRYAKLDAIRVANMWGVNYCREQLGSGDAAARTRR